YYIAEEAGSARAMILNEQIDEPIDLERWGQLALACLSDEGIPAKCELSVQFITEWEIAKYNHLYMEDSNPTDVLAFPIDAADLGLPRVLGDLEGVDAD